jgi:aryl-alcohol dehydrogenase-like predicted oxidoreductase
MSVSLVLRVMAALRMALFSVAPALYQALDRIATFAAAAAEGRPRPPVLSSSCPAPARAPSLQRNDDNRQRPPRPRSCPARAPRHMERTDMDYRNLGKTGLKVSELCLGAMTFGRECDETLSYRMMDRFAEAGGNFIDTADVYSAGRSEEIVGAWLKGKDREDWVLATKVRFGTMGRDRVNRSGLSRKHIAAEVDASLKRLQVDYIDLYQVHCWDRFAPLEETLSTLNDIVRAGKVRYIGASNYSGWQLQKAIDISKANGWEPFTCLQALYNLLDRELEWELLPVAHAEGLGVLPWSPLRGGWLSGKYRRGMTAPGAGTRIEIAASQGWSETWERYGNEFTWKLVDAMEATGKAPAQVALNWLLRQPGVTAPIIGARTMEQLESNLGAVGWVLTADEVAGLDKASHRPLPYPYDFHVDAGAR